MNSIPIIDYSVHPAFADLPVKRDHGAALLEEMLSIDKMLDGAAGAQDFQRASESSWTRMATILRDTVSAESLCDQTELAMYKAFDTMTAYCRWKTKPKTKIRQRHRTIETANVLEQITDQGCARTKFPTSVRSQLMEMLSAEMAQTEARHAVSPIDRCTLHMNMKGAAFDLAWKTLRKMGLTTALSELFGREVEPRYWYLAFNTASESWYENCYADVGIPTSRFAYAHFDNDFELAKIQIYLTDVAEENGPFAFVPGSHKWSGCKTQQFIFKEMDRTLKYPKDDTLYYRPRFGCPEHREELLQLPVPLQGSSHFGDDVVRGSDLDDQLARSFHTVTSDQGNCCVFAGGDLLHYGGLVSGADRWVLQLGVATERPHSAGPAPSQTFFRRLATRGRKYVGDKPIDTLRRLMGYTDALPRQNQYTPTAEKDKSAESSNIR